MIYIMPYMYLFKAYLLQYYPLWSLNFIVGPPNITPTNDRFIPINSAEDVTYNCSAVDPGHTVFWEIGGLQITNPMLFTVHMEFGMSIQPNHTDSPISSISISEMARKNYEEPSILLVCLSQPPRTDSSTPILMVPRPARSGHYYVRTFGKLFCMIAMLHVFDDSKKIVLFFCTQNHCLVMLWMLLIVSLGN